MAINGQEFNQTHFDDIAKKYSDLKPGESRKITEFSDKTYKDEEPSRKEYPLT